MPTPIVSVLVNNYNYGRFLRPCIESALRQTVPCEVVVVDDGSTDDSMQVLNRFRDGVTVISQENRGQAAAINAGVRRCSGDVIALLDADDVMRPDRVERVQTAFARDSSASWLRHNMRLVDEDGAELNPAMYASSGQDDPALDLLHHGDTWGATSGLCFRRALLDRMGPIPEANYRYYADAYLILAAGLLGTCLSLPESLTDRRQHSRQVSNRNRPTPDHVRAMMRMRADVADAAVALSRSAGQREVRGTWWQRKAQLQLARLDDVPIRERVQLWGGYVRALMKGPLPFADSVAFVVRDSVLMLVPLPHFESLWWYTHDGRPVLRRGTRTARAADESAEAPMAPGSPPTTVSKAGGWV